MLRLAEELLLLLLDDRTGDFSNLPDRTLGYALAGAALMDLALEGRIDTDTDSLTLTDPTPVGDDLLDPILADIAEELNARPDALPTIFWIRRIAERAHELRDNALARLADRGILDADDGLTMFALSRLTARARRYPRAEGESEREIHARVMGVLFGSDIPSPEDAMIVGLAHACGAFRQMLTTAEYEEVEGRIELVARLDLIGQSVTGAIRNLSLAESHTLTPGHPGPGRRLAAGLRGTALGRPRSPAERRPPRLLHRAVSPTRPGVRGQRLRKNHGGAGGARSQFIHEAGGKVPSAKPGVFRRVVP